MGKVKSKSERNAEKKLQIEARKIKKKEKEQKRKDGVPKGIPKTIENMRVKDETVIGDLNLEDNVEKLNEINNDELSSYFEKTYEPKILITTSKSPGTKTRVFCRELTRIIPNSTVKYRQNASLKKLIKLMQPMGFTDLIVVNDDRKIPNGLLLSHLPDGPTAHFRLSNVKITTELRKNYKKINKERPEVILNNFTTKLGYTVSRMLAAIFHFDPEFKGRRCATFHNQRDYIFFRHHEYNFTEKGKARLKELGPRFTLKLRSLQEGTFDSKTGEYTWIIAGRRHELETSRRKFFL